MSAAKPHFLVTAGNTHEAIDQVREWTNIFTGQTGLDIALALTDLGDVTLLTSNLQHAEAHNGYYGKHGMLGVETFRSHADLRALLAHHLTTPPPPDALYMTAAVSDYRPAGAYRVVAVEKVLGTNQERWLVEDVFAGKIKSTHDRLAFLGTPTEKLIDLVRSEWHYRGLLVKFKLEVGLSEDQLRQVAEASRRASQADYIVANTLEMVRGPAPGAWLLGEGIQERILRPDLARRLQTLAHEALAR